MNYSKKINIVVAGLGNVGSHVIKSIADINNNLVDKTKIQFNILGISAKDKTKKRIFNVDDYNWVDNPLELLNLSNCDILIELIGEEKGVSYDLIKKALEKNIHVITANKALLSINGKDLFDIADRSYVLGEHTVIAEGTSREILKSSKAIEHYFGSQFS